MSENSTNREGEPPNTQGKEFSIVTYRFTENLLVLRIFCQQLGNIADEHDLASVEALNKALESLSSRDASTTDPKQQAIESVDTVDVPKEESNEAADKWLEEQLANDPKKQRAFFAAIKAFTKKPPRMGEVLRQGALITLMSYFESLVSDIIHHFYLLHPEALPAGDRSITLSELREYGSIQDAESGIATKEVESVLRDSIDGQLNYFSKRLKIDVSPINEQRKRVIEIDSRRNIYVHNRGIINRIYLSRVDVNLIKEFDLKIDTPATVSSSYLTQAIDEIEIAGLYLIQSCWRKWRKDECALADAAFIETTFEALKEKRHSFVQCVANLANNLAISNDESKRIVCVNHAIALRDCEKNNEIDAVISRFDWSASGPRFMLALTAIKKDADAFYSLLPKAVASEEISVSSLREWPLFSVFRGEPRFEEALGKLPPQYLQPSE